MRRDERTNELFNSDRADRAAAALDAYRAYTGDAPDESPFRALLCDLRHLAARQGAGDKGCPRERDLTFDEANAIAGRCFEDEVYIETNADQLTERRPVPIPPPELPTVDWREPVQWSTGEEITFAPYDECIGHSGHHVSACEEWTKVTGDNFVAVDDHGFIIGCEDELYPTVINVPEGEA